MEQPDERLAQLQSALAEAEARMLSARKSLAGNQQLIDAREAVFAARNALAGYEAELKRRG
jgi:hypothetical protein